MRRRWASAIAVCSALLLAGAAGAQEKEVIRAPGAPPGLPFSPAVRVGNLLFLSGQIGTVPETLQLVSGGIGPEARQTLENIRTILEHAGATLADVVKCTVFLRDIADWPAMNEVYREYFAEDPPARSAVAGSGLALGARVEIECTAVVRSEK